MNEEELKRQLLEAGGFSVWAQKSDPTETGIKIARILHCLKNKPESEQRAMINKIRIEGIDKAFKWL